MAPLPNNDHAAIEPVEAGAAAAALAAAGLSREPHGPWLTGRLDSFVHAVSHDLGAPLRAVAVSLDLIAKRHAEQLDPHGGELLRLAIDGSTRLQRMIERLVAVSRARRRYAPVRRVSLETVLAAALARHEPELEALQAALDVDPLPEVPGDERLLATMLAELLGNALTFTRLETAPRIEIKAIAQQQHLLLAVRDNGIGVPADRVAQIFEPFTRLHADDDYPGLGLGLTLCREIAEAHGGFIYAYPNVAPGTGLTVIVGLPAQSDAV